jgi:hypothetical protein
MRNVAMGGSGRTGSEGGVRVRVGGSPSSAVKAELCGAGATSSVVRGAAEASAVAAAASRSLRLVGASVICKERRLQLETRQQLLRRST